MTKTNDNKDVTDIVPKEEGSIEPKPSKEDLFIRNLFLYKTVKEAAIKAGYTKNTASSTVYVKLKNERFKNKIREYAINNDLLCLPKIAFIEEQVLDHLVKNPLDLPKFRHTVKEKKRIAGILQPDALPEPPPTINIESLKVFWQGVFPDKPEPKPIDDAEIIDTK